MKSLTYSLTEFFYALFNFQDVKLKVVILEFIATAVETQPGLIELFLDLSSKDDKVNPW